MFFLQKYEFNQKITFYKILPECCTKTISCRRVTQSIEGYRK